MSHQPRRALRLPEVMVKTGLRKTQIFDSVRRGIFPKPFNVLPGGRAVAWDEAEIDAHLERQMAERDLEVA
jgi:predicted DNA-binding transcriptional regulator AlpA